MRRSVILAIVLIVAQFISAFVLYPSMPERMAVHWNLQGEADGYDSKLVGLFLIPLIQLVLFPVFLVMPRLDPKKGIQRFREVYEWFILGFVGFMALINSLSYAWNLGWRFNFTQVMVPLLAVMLYGIGEFIGRAKINWFAGIRTPWTLSSEEVWDRTHSLGGKLFKACGIISLIGLLLGEWATFILLIGSVLLSTLYLVYYSYSEYQRVEKEETGDYSLGRCVPVNQW